MCLPDRSPPGSTAAGAGAGTAASAPVVVPPPPVAEVPPGEVAANLRAALAYPPQPLLLIADAGRYIKQAGAADNTFEIIVGRLQVFTLQAAPKRVQVGDETVANYALLSTTELSLQGLRVGSTVLNLWFKDLDDPNKTKMVSFLARAAPTRTLASRLERAYKNSRRRSTGSSRTARST
ncbi:MAG: pilus assembly protein N-terminal domain-containing protein [Gemmataceae bacterium]